MTTLRQLEYAVAVADHAHFGRAAEAVAVSQPGLSAQVQALEQHLGITLFERSPRGVQLTAAGRDVVDRARLVLRDVRELEAAAAAHHGSMRGTVRIGAIPTMAPYLLPPLVRTLARQWPDAELQLEEHRTAALVARVERGELDLALLALPVDTGSLHVEALAHEPFVLAVPDGHPLVGTGPVPVGALAELPMLLLDEGHCLREHALAACQVAGGALRRDIHSASLATLTQMVAGGRGVTLLPVTALPVEARPGVGVTACALAAPAPGRTIALAWRATDGRAAFLARAGRAFADQLGELIGPPPAPAGRPTGRRPPRPAPPRSRRS